MIERNRILVIILPLKKTIEIKYHEDSCRLLRWIW